MISLNFTVSAANINPTPIEKTIRYTNGIITKNIVKCNSCLVNNITRINAQNDDRILIELDAILDTTNKYLGIYTFFINGAFPNIDVIAPEVASL
ncbi:Uncharacterised protein [Dorea longicatena]|nr:Uncharacterised protein [Dorea longicatena]